MRLWHGMGVAAVAAVVAATGAFGVSSGRTITTIAGTRRTQGFSGDGGPATSAQLNDPRRGGGGRAGERLHRRHQ